MLTGPDCSWHNGSPNWAQVKAGGHTYAFIKATEGTSYPHTDWFRANWGPLKASGLIPGAYHFLRDDSDPAAQARYFVATVGSFTGVLAAVDVETGSNNSLPSAAQARAFANEFKRLVPGHPLILYTGRWYWRDTIGNPIGADIGPLWHSAYSSVPGSLYGGWQTWEIWQHTSSGSCPGISGNVDLNRFLGGRDQLLSLTSPTEADVPLTDDDVNKIITKLVPYVKVVMDERLNWYTNRVTSWLATGRSNALMSPANDGYEFVSDPASFTLNEVAKPADIPRPPTVDQIASAIPKPPTADEVAAAVKAVLPADPSTMTPNEIHDICMAAVQHASQIAWAQSEPA